MAELPEVHTISNDLNNLVKDYTIDDVKVLSNYRILPDKDTFIKQVKGKPITQVTRVAKNIIIELGDNLNIGLHLAMTGQILVRNDNVKQPNWTHIILLLRSNTDTQTIYYTDMRMFGKITLMDNEQLQVLKDKYGPEPIDPNADPADFYERIRSKRTSIKNAILDQAVISGLGNIYATDALFLARIHPETPTQKMSSDMANRLFESAKNILLEGIEHRGSTLADKMYVDIYGKEGTQQNYFRVYGKQDCPNCATKLEFKKVGGRGTYFCSKCQNLSGQEQLF